MFTDPERKLLSWNGCWYLVQKPMVVDVKCQQRQECDCTSKANV